jgi:hypothetical protein
MKNTMIKIILSAFATVFIFSTANAETPKYSVSGSNYMEYSDMLSEGEKAMFANYPDTYRMDVYGSAAACSIPDTIASISNNNGEMINDNEGVVLENAGQVPFPNPSHPQHWMWNARLGQGWYSNVEREQTITNVDSVGSITVGSQNTNIIFPSHPNANEGYEDGLWALFMQKNTAPARADGITTLVHDYIDSYASPRRAWQYSPATRRVRRAPNITYDTLTTASPLITVDQYGTFNGAQDKYDWSYKGTKKMLVVSGHNNAIGQMPIEETHTVNHLNPDHIKFYEGDVAIIHAELKTGQRHLYGSRTFYISTTDYSIVAQDIYDGKGQLMRHSINILSNDIGGVAEDSCNTSGEFTFDFATKTYAGNNLLGSGITTIPANYGGDPKDASFYTPDGLRRYSR